MEYNKDKVAEYVLALLYITTHGDKNSLRAWKGMDWDTLDHLFEKGYICDPKNKTKSVLFTDKGQAQSKLLFEKYFRE